MFFDVDIWKVLKVFDVDILGSKISFDVDSLGFKNPKIYSYVLWRQIWRFSPKCWRLFRLNTWSHCKHLKNKNRSRQLSKIAVSIT